MQFGENGEILVPREYQRRLGWKPGAEIEFDVAGEALIVRQVSLESEGKDLVEAMRGKGRLKLRTSEVMKLLRATE